MTKIYTVESGSYSDYNVHGVFSTREKAEEYARRFNLMHRYPGGASYYDEAEVVERELDQEHEEPKFTYAVKVMGDSLEKPEYYPEQEGSYYPRVTQVLWRDYATSPLVRRPYWGGQAVGSTPEEAQKAAYDAVAKARAIALGL